MNIYHAHLAAALVAIKLISAVGYNAVSRASWHLAVVTNAVAFGWGHGAERDAENVKLAEQLQIARDVVTHAAEDYGLFRAYQEQLTLNNNWKLRGVAPHVEGLPDFNIHWNYLDAEGNVKVYERV